MLLRVSSKEDEDAVGGEGHGGQNVKRVAFAANDQDELLAIVGDILKEGKSNAPSAGGRSSDTEGSGLQVVVEESLYVRI